MVGVNFSIVKRSRRVTFSRMKVALRKAGKLAQMAS